MIAGKEEKKAVKKVSKSDELIKELAKETASEANKANEAKAKASKEIEKETKEKISSSPPADVATFIKVETPSMYTDGLRVYNKNEAYEYRWCFEKRLSNNRIGNWVVVDKKHPDFAKLRVEIDHTPDATYFKFKDLILCCCRAETAAKRRSLLAQKNKAMAGNIKDKYSENIKKISHSLGDRSEAIKVMKSIDEEE